MLDYLETSKLADKAEGYTHFFSSGAKRFFDSKIGSIAWVVSDNDGSQYAYFTTSERFHGSEGSAARMYSVRCLKMLAGRTQWTCDTIGEFQAYRTSKAAVKAMESAAMAHDVASGFRGEQAEWYRIHVQAREAFRAAKAQ